MAVKQIVNGGTKAFMDSTVAKVNKRLGKANIDIIDDIKPTTGERNFIDNLSNNPISQVPRDLIGAGDGTISKGTDSAGIGDAFRAIRGSLDSTKKKYGGQVDEYTKQLDNQELDEASKKLIQGELSVARKNQAAATREYARTFVDQGLSYAARFGRHTFMEGTMGDRAKKVALYGGAGFAGATAMRGVTGGGVTYNASGERDIAGIPFV